MMNYELYVNDTLMDVEDNINLTLLYKSMLFTDLKSLVSNRSVGFSLPKTANNLRAIENSHLSDIKDDPGDKYLYPRRGHKVDYYRNGVPIVSGGLGMLVDIKEKINFVFVFGNMENTQWLEDKLSDLDEKASDYLDWNTNASIMAYGEDLGFPCMDFGLGVKTTVDQYTHPAVSANWIIDRMAATNGLTIERGNHFDNLYIPLVAKETSELIHGSTRLSFKPMIKTRQNGIFKEFYLVPGGNPTTPEPNLYPSPDEYGFIGGKDKYSGTVRVALNSGQNFKLYYKYTLPIGFAIQVIGVRAGKESTIATVNPGGSDEYQGMRRCFFNVDLSLNMTAYDSFRIKLGSTLINQDDVILDRSFYDDQIWIQVEELEFPDKYPIIPNLPDMKQVEFLKYMMQLRGLFAYPKDKNVVGMVSCKDIVESMGYAADWTDKLITNSPITNAPEEMEFRMDKFAQQNWCLWTNDTEIEDEKANAFMVTENEIIEKTADVLKLPFSSSINKEYTVGDESFTAAYVPIYTNKDGKISYKKPKSRVMSGKGEEIIKDQSERLVLSFERLDFSQILNNYYVEYQSMIRRPRVIIVRVRLTDLDMGSIDMARSVYLEQFGRHYAILNIQASPNGVCKCKLLEIPNTIIFSQNQGE